MMDNKKIIKINQDYFSEWVKMGCQLWPNNSYEKLSEEFKGLLNSEKEETFLYLENNKAVGFINLSIREDYVNGSRYSPVGYVEGIYVKPEFRKKGIAKALVKIGEMWAKSLGCKEMGSDVLIENKDSADFHKKIGFKDVETVICFIKDI